MAGGRPCGRTGTAPTRWLPAWPPNGVWMARRGLVVQVAETRYVPGVTPRLQAAVDVPVPAGAVFDSPPYPGPATLVHDPDVANPVPASSTMWTGPVDAWTAKRVALLMAYTVPSTPMTVGVYASPLPDVRTIFWLKVLLARSQR